MNNHTKDAAAAMPPLMGAPDPWAAHMRPRSERPSPASGGPTAAGPAGAPFRGPPQIPAYDPSAPRKPIVGPPYIPPLMPRSSQAEPQNQPAFTTRAEAANHAPQGTARPSLPTTEAGATTARDLTAPDPDAADPEAQALANVALVDAAERAKAAAVSNPVGPPLDWTPDASTAVPLASGPTMLVAREQSAASPWPTAASASAAEPAALGTVAQVGGGGAAASAATAPLTPRAKKGVPPKAASKKAGANRSKHPARAKAPSRAAPKVLTKQTPEKISPAGKPPAVMGAPAAGASVTAPAPAGRNVLQAASETTSPKTARNKRKRQRKERIAEGRPRAMKSKAARTAPAPRPPSIAASEKALSGRALAVQTVPHPKVVMVRIDELQDSKGPRRDLGDLTDLIASIAAVGVLHPIIIDKKGNIIAGHRRVAACLALGLKLIPAIVLAGGTIQQRLAAIDENLCRKDLNALERGEWLAERKVLYEELHPEARQGGAPGIAGGGKKTKPPGSGGFVPDTAVRTGRGKSTISEEVKIASIVPDVRDKLRATPLANQKGQLLRLAKCDAQKQRTIAKLVVNGDVNSVAAALKCLAGNDSTGSALEEAPKVKRGLRALRNGQDTLRNVYDYWAETSAHGDPVLPLFEKTLACLVELIATVDQQLVPRRECSCRSDSDCPACGGKGWLSTADLEEPESGNEPEEVEDPPDAPEDDEDPNVPSQ